MRCVFMATAGLVLLCAGCDERCDADRAGDDRKELVRKAWVASQRNPTPLGTVPRPEDWPGTPLPDAPWVFVADRPGTVVMPSVDWRRLDAVWRAPAGTPDPVPDLVAAANAWAVDRVGGILLRGRECLRYSRTPQGDLRIEQWESQP